MRVGDASLWVERWSGGTRLRVRGVREDDAAWREDQQEVVLSIDEVAALRECLETGRDVARVVEAWGRRYRTTWSLDPPSEFPGGRGLPVALPDERGADDPADRRRAAARGAGRTPRALAAGLTSTGAYGSRTKSSEMTRIIATWLPQARSATRHRRKNACPGTQVATQKPTLTNTASHSASAIV